MKENYLKKLFIHLHSFYSIYCTYFFSILFPRIVHARRKIETETTDNKRSGMELPFVLCRRRYRLTRWVHTNDVCASVSERDSLNMCSFANTTIRIGWRRGRDRSFPWSFCPHIYTHLYGIIRVYPTKIYSVEGTGYEI